MTNRKTRGIQNVLQHTFDPVRCVFCHDDIPTVLTTAHHFHKNERLAEPERAGIDGTSRLCWSCHHGLLHFGVISIEEVLEAEAATRAGSRKVTHDEVYRRIAADLKAGRREIDPGALHNLTPEQLTDRAVKASDTRRRRTRGSEPPLFPTSGGSAA
jgi:hypothetical protein